MDSANATLNLKSLIDETVATVFDTMLGLHAELSVPGALPKEKEIQVMGMVGLGGTTRGVVCLRVGQEFSQIATAAMFGLEPGSQHSIADVNDVIGELTNIIAGRVLTYLHSKKENCSLSLPTITRGEKIDLESISCVDRQSFTFSFPSGPVIVELYSLNKEHNGMNIPKILLVDDSRATRAILAKLFFPYYCEIIEAADGALGLEMARLHHPDLIVLDMTMPVMSGIETLDKLKADPTTEPIPVIMLSANSDPAQIAQLKAKGLLEYVTKSQKPKVILDSALTILKLEPKVPSV
jgi:CheY-like chemotaxis protein